MSLRLSNSQSIELTGLDGTNPLGFLAALGTLVVARKAGESAARLRWMRGRTWTAVLDGLTTGEPTRLSERLAEGLRGKDVSRDAAKKRDDADIIHQQGRTAVKKEMEKIKKEKLKGQDRKAAIDARVRPLEESAGIKRTEWLVALKDAVPRPELALGARLDCTASEYREYSFSFREGAQQSISREALDFMAAFGSDACVDKSEAIEPTPFCFIKGSGQQYFLDTALQLMTKVDSTRIERTLLRPWTYEDEKLSMRWDPIEDRRYALIDRDPTAADNKTRTVWMANLLAYRALVLFPCAPTRRGLATTAWTTIENEITFTWPLWEFAAGPDTVRTLLQLDELLEARLDRRALDARGIAAVFRARRIRFPPSGSSYKLNFSPARAV